MEKRRRFLMVVLAGLMLSSLQLEACSKKTPTPTPTLQATPTSTATPTATPATTATPTLTITSPANGATVPAGNIAVTAQVTNFSVVDKQGQPNISGEGHLHFYLDVAAPTAAGQPAVPPSGVWAHVSGTTYTFPNVAAGTHTISVQLVNNNHTPVVPLVVVTINFTCT